MCTDAIADAMGLVSALVVEKELEDAREKRVRSTSFETDDKSKDPWYVCPEVYHG